MWFRIGIPLALLAALGLVTFDLLVHYWAGRFANWTDLRHHLLYLIGMRRADRPLHRVKGKLHSDARIRRPEAATAPHPDRRAVGGETYRPDGEKE